MLIGVQGKLYKSLIINMLHLIQWRCSPALSSLEGRRGRTAARSLQELRVAFPRGGRRGFIASPSPGFPLDILFDLAARTPFAKSLHIQCVQRLSFSRGGSSDPV